ncbi:MAG: hypothetical protein K2O10_00415 [Muribaculaceae bacterium]|nr:hypothetical protein [Muribaculaceae bacterium]
MKSLKSRLLMALALVAIVLTSCSKDSNVLSRIPADADLVMKVDMVKVYENAGCAVDGGRVTLSDQLLKLLWGNPGDAQARFASELFASGSVDLNHVFMVVSFKGGDPVLMAAVNDRAALEKCLVGGGMSAVDAQGWSCWSTGEEYGLVLLVADDVVVMTDGEDAADAVAIVNKTLDGASKKSIADSDWKSNLLMASNTVDMVVKFDNVPQFAQLKSYGNAVVTLDLDGAKASATSEFRDDDGKLVDRSNGIEKFMTDIDTSMLKYLNSNDMVVTAFGVKSDFPWQQAGQEMEKAQPGSSQIFALIISYLKSLNGTTIIGFGPKQGAGSFMASGISDFTAYWDVVLATQLTAGSAEKYITQIEAFVKMQGDGAGVTAERMADNTLKIMLDGVAIYASADGNTLLVKTSPEATGSPTVDAAMLKGHSNILAARIPVESALATDLSLTFGTELSIWSEKAVGHLELQLTGTDQPLLKTLLDQFGR